jgi:hypothetical protein
MMKKALMCAGYLLVAFLATAIGAAGVHAGCEEGNCTNGPGRYAWPDGSSYTGDFLNGKFHGQGTYAWADGKKYVGGFKNDKRTGRGTFTWPNGASYKGEWENGKKSGYGIYTFPDGRKNIGIWENDSLSQKMEEAEVETLLAPKAAPSAAAVTAAAAGPAAADSATADLDKQLAALGGEVEPAAADEEQRIQATEAAATAQPPAAGTPFVISVQKLSLVDGRKFNTWENIPLLAVGPIMPIGTCSVKVDAGASDKSAGTFMVQLKIANNSGCPLDFKGFVQAGDTYVKLVSWSGDQAIAPQSTKEISKAVTLDKDAPRSDILFKLQGEGCRM